MSEDFVLPSKEVIFERVAGPLFQQSNAQTKESLLAAIKNARMQGFFLPEADIILLRVIGDILRRETYTDSNGKSVAKYLFDEKEGVWVDQEILAHVSTNHPEKQDIWTRRGDYVRRLTRAQRRKRRVRDGITKKIKAIDKRIERVNTGEVFKAPSLWDNQSGTKAS